MSYAILITTSGYENIKLLLSKIKDIKIKIYIVTPDKINIKSKNIEIIKDLGIGKGEAINLALKEIKEDIIIFTDGDVITNKKSIKSLINAFDDNTGLVSGKVVSLNNKKTLFGFWSHFLVFAADNLREKKYINNDFFEATGYLFAIRKTLFKKIPKNTLSEDGYISYTIYNSGYRLKYDKNALVYVKFPDNFSDWIKQKRRATGGYTQGLVKNTNRSFIKEAYNGFLLLFIYPKNIKEFFYLLLLFIARIYLWIVIFIDLKMRKIPFEKVWVRVESTK